MISNLIPSSSNIIKVHDDPKNQTLHSSEQKPASYNLQQQHSMMGYDPLQLITNFDQNSFLKGLPADTGPVATNPFSFPNSSAFSFDESQMSNAHEPLFAMPQGQHFTGSQTALNMQTNDKPYPSMQMFDHEDNYHNHNNQQNRHNKLVYQDNYYNQNDDNSGPVRYPSNQHSYTTPLNEGQSKQEFGNHMSESFLHKELYQGARAINYQGDYFPVQHHRLPASGSGNYDYKEESHPSFSEPSRENFFNSMAESEANNGEKINYPYKKRPIAISYVRPTNQQYDNKENQQESNEMRTFYLNQQKENNIASTERPYYSNFSPLTSNTFGNESKHPSTDQGTSNDFYSHLNKAPSDIDGHHQKNDPKSNMFEAQEGKLDPKHSEPASYNSYFTGFHSAASVLKPVVVKNELHDSLSSEERSLTNEKLLPIMTANGVNVFPYAQMKANLPRPVASRIKEFFKSMLTQKY